MGDWDNYDGKISCKSHHLQKNDIHTFLTYKASKVKMFS